LTALAIDGPESPDYAATGLPRGRQIMAVYVLTLRPMTKVDTKNVTPGHCMTPGVAVRRSATLEGPG
jgi:hypothetical protein